MRDPALIEPEEELRRQCVFNPGCLYQWKAAAESHGGQLFLNTRALALRASTSLQEVDTVFARRKRVWVAGKFPDACAFHGPGWFAAES